MTEEVTQSQPVQPEVVASPAVTNVEFIETIAEDLRGQSNLKNFKDVNQLAKSYVELQRMVGNSVRIPPADATPEAKKDFLDKIRDVDGVLFKDDEKLYDKLGRPESADKYTLESIVKAELLSEVPSLTSEINEYKQVAHEIGLTDNQAKRLLELQLSKIDAVKATNVAQRDAAEAELKKAWGADYDNRIAGIQSLAKVYAAKNGDAMQALINSGAANNPVLLHMMNDLAVSLKEKGHVGLSSNQFGITPEAAKQSIADKRSDRGFMTAYHDDSHPNHKKAVEELQKLYSIARGE